MGSNPNNLIGKTLGTCTLEKLIGQGGMGAVYLARQNRPSRQVAVKVLLPNVTTDSPVYREFLTRFRREADVIAKLEHVNIMPIYDYGEQDGFAYLVMPYLPNGSLRDVLEHHGPFALQETLIYISQAASALDYAHAHKVIHRDLKPGNFLMHSDGRLVLADFGIARMIQDSDGTFAATLTSTGMLLGTPEYMAPEMLNGEQVDHRADIYGLGIVLFQMLSGQVPFKGNTPFAVATKHLQEPPPALHQLNPAIPTSVNTVVQKALAKNPADRFMSAGLLAQALQQAISIPNYSSDDETYIPTVLSSSPTISPIVATPRYQTPPTVYPNPITPPNTAYGTPLPVPTNRQQPLLFFIGILLVLVLVVGGVLVGLQLNKGTTVPSSVTGNTSSTGTITTANTPHSSTSTAATQTTPTSGITPTSIQQSSVPKGAVLYRATSPGTCDSNGGQWVNYNSPTILCQSTGTEIVNPHSGSPNLVGTILKSIPNNNIYPNDYVIEAQLQQIGPTQANFGIYFRNQSGNQQGIYTFFINSNGTWYNYVYDNITAAQSLVNKGTFNGASGPVTVDVVVVGSNFSFYLNGQLIGRANDGTYSIGTVGIAVDAGGTILVSNFALYATQ